MVRVLIVTLLVGLFLGSSTEAARISEGRIVGGDATDTNQIPYIVSIAVPYYGNVPEHTCGGSIIADKWILTAAHCLIPVEGTVVRAGSALNAEGGITAKVLEVIMHRNYDGNTSHNDIALLKLDRSVIGPNGGKIIKMIEQGEKVEAGQVARVSGWGRTTFEDENISAALRTVQVDIIDSATCIEGYKSAFHTITNGMICASRVGKDACTNDSGGPLVINDNLLIGVVSHGYECARENYPGVYTKIALYRNWIRDNSGV